MLQTRIRRSARDVRQRWVEGGFPDMREVVQDLDVELAPDQLIQPQLRAGALFF
jgi:hypothetical protein